jgi:hypothetical protein
MSFENNNDKANCTVSVVRFEGAEAIMEKTGARVRFTRILKNEDKPSCSTSPLQTHQISPFRIENGYK